MSMRSLTMTYVWIGNVFLLAEISVYCHLGKKLKKRNQRWYPWIRFVECNYLIVHWSFYWLPLYLAVIFSVIWTVLSCLENTFHFEVLLTTQACSCRSVSKSTYPWQPILPIKWKDIAHFMLFNIKYAIFSKHFTYVL